LNIEKLITKTLIKYVGQFEVTNGHKITFKPLGTSNCFCLSDVEIIDIDLLKHLKNISKNDWIKFFIYYDILVESLMIRYEYVYDIKGIDPNEYTLSGILLFINKYINDNKSIEIEIKNMWMLSKIFEKSSQFVTSETLEKTTNFVMEYHLNSSKHSKSLDFDLEQIPISREDFDEILHSIRGFTKSYNLKFQKN